MSIAAGNAGRKAVSLFGRRPDLHDLHGLTLFIWPSLWLDTATKGESERWFGGPKRKNAS